jgi:peptidoglycan/xylan/chitin deacetylase (PgdA/CDA1 family)
MLRRIRIGLLEAANATGLSRRIGRSAWRQSQLLILCYHGVTDGDLDQWNPSLFLNAQVFRRRMALLRDAGCSVLGLADALQRMERGTLPPRSVVLTFDDGFADFNRVAWPILREFGFPATLYLTTYYMVRNLPVFDPALGYLLWSGRNQQLDWPEITGRPVLLDASGRLQMSRALLTYALKKKLTALEKDGLLQDLATRLGLDYCALRESRAVSLINEDEAQKLSAAGVDLQMHTHRHRASIHQDRFLREVVDNRDCMASMGLQIPEHFCFPGGVYGVNDSQWLRELGIKSAVTCDAGFAAPGSDLHSLPRVADCSPFTEVEFVSWLYGTAALLPHRGSAMNGIPPVQELETEIVPHVATPNG